LTLISPEGDKRTHPIPESNAAYDEKLKPYFTIACNIGEF
jgi:hypothetical protein